MHEFPLVHQIHFDHGDDLVIMAMTGCWSCMKILFRAAFMTPTHIEPTLFKGGLPDLDSICNYCDVSKTYWLSWPKVKEWYLGELELWEFTKGEYVKNAGQCQDGEKAAFPKGFLCPHSTSLPGWEYEMNYQLLKTLWWSYFPPWKTFYEWKLLSEWTSMF